MRVIPLYWFTEQQTSTCRCKKSCSIYSNFSVEENELIPSAQNPQEVAKKLQKPNNARKPYIYVFWGLRVNTYKHHLTETIFIFTIFVSISRPRPIYTLFLKEHFIRTKVLILAKKIKSKPRTKTRLLKQHVINVVNDNIPVITMLKSELFRININ